MTELDLKYRPTTFDRLAGQGHITDFLSERIHKRNPPRQIILHGPHGMGKTSLARIYARALYYSSRLSDASPCGCCDSCRQFAAGALPDFHEYNGAKDGTIARVRELLNVV